MTRGTGRSLERPGGRRLAKGLILAGIAVGVPLTAAALLRRRVEPPHAFRWGRAHRYAGPLGTVVFQELGSGPPIVLLHGFGPGYDANQWRAAAEILAERFNVFVPDLPGWGRSDGPPAGAHGAGPYIEAIEDFLSAVVREPAVIVAAGLTAAYATRLAADLPELVRGLALVSPLGLGSDGAPEGGGFVATLLRLPVLGPLTLDLLTGRSALDHHLRREVYAAPERVDAALLEHHYRACHVGRTRASLASWLRGDLWHDATGAVADLTVPVWLSWGRQSKSPSPEDAGRWLELLPDADVEIFQGSGSLPHAETPALFCRSLERFIAGLPDSD
jgi:pimeloyl-ACP methyl ester carboxylesterase